ncbi:MaoC family dehydratase [Hydrocarboniclastica marina]|uniref:MaoC family dehydratase n=1 Tax=Hydrocarboniclastica marina TaxID=2259620 RepID=A0A4V1D8E3_9ALTE|nr:MaoC family dehydratase [Hydrocarboniclastica marina]QCF24890.1 MaoC family dehydratase [Hydrocarboniclastica marina]
MKVFPSLEALAQVAGEDIGVSDWVLVDQARIQAFADATGDHQWIHLDQERAAQESPYKTTIAHGYLTLSLLPMLNQQIMRTEGVSATINYGLDKLRFPSPVPAGKRVRCHLKLLSLEPAGDSRHLARFRSTIEIEGSERPACVAENLAMYLS